MLVSATQSHVSSHGNIEPYQPPLPLSLPSSFPSSFPLRVIRGAVEYGPAARHWVGNIKGTCTRGDLHVWTVGVLGRWVERGSMWCVIVWKSGNLLWHSPCSTPSYSFDHRDSPGYGGSVCLPACPASALVSQFNVATLINICTCNL